MYDHAQYDSNVKEYSGSAGAITGSVTGIRKDNTEVHDFVLHYTVPSVKGLWFRLFHVLRDNDTRQYEQEHTRLIANLSF